MTLTATRTARLLIVIVNYRTPALTIDCLNSLEPEVRELENARVVVADNASGDGSPERIRDAIEEHRWSSWASLRALERNGGFAYGNNAVIAPALAGAADRLPDFVLLLNSDTYVRPGALSALLEFMDSHPDVGIAGSRVEEPDGTLQHSRYRFHSVWSEFDNGLRLGLVTRILHRRSIAPPLVETAHSTDWVVGACMIVRREVFEDIGLFDEGYFLYFEEADFCLAARRAGWSCWYVPASRVVHLVGRSTGFTSTSGPPQRRPRYWFESRRRYFVKNHGRLYALCADVAWVVGFATWRVRRIVQQKPDSDPPHMLLDFLRVRIRPGRRVRRDTASKDSSRTLRRVALGLVVALAALEIAARIATSRGYNGMPFIGHIPLAPFRPDATLVDASLARIRSSTYVVADAELGWSICNDGESADESGRPLYRSNHQGLRAAPDREFALEVPREKLRIVTVGDSFTHGDEVFEAETWQHGLEARRADLEVLNLGVPGFGTDQALLRWRRDGRPFRAQIVVLGIWPENMCRNLGFVRYYLVPSDGFASKPMMIVRDGALAVLNSPTMDRDALIATLTHPESEPLLANDFWYRERETRASFVQSSRLVDVAESLAFAVERKRTRSRLYSGEDPAGIAITTAIAEQFARDVRATGSTPLVLLFPMRDLLEMQSSAKPFPLLAALREHGVDVLDLAPAVAREALERGVARLFTAEGHLTAEGNRVLAESLEIELRPWLAAARR